ncbi:MAG TPA: hypothetical protein VK978_00990, partial [Candidatus Saccharimonadales bacterium]|nr:hypothetical protein [Candidatus Saccharimonadales bacterium]
MLLPRLLSLLAPHDCLGCGAEGRLICVPCQADMPPAIMHCYRCLAPATTMATCAACRAVSPLRSVQAAACYEGMARDLVWKLKFGRAGVAADEMAAIMSDRTVSRFP